MFQTIDSNGGRRLFGRRPFSWAVFPLLLCFAGEGCSSTPDTTGTPGNQGSDEASAGSSSGSSGGTSGSATSGSGGSGSSTGGSADASSGSNDMVDAPPPPACDAAITLPATGAPGAACGKCLQTKCTMVMATCATDCACASSVECLAGMNWNVPSCPVAMNAFFSDSNLTDVNTCVNNSCQVCNGPGG